MEDGMAEARFVGGDLILKVLAEHDVDVIFGYPGGVTLPLYDRLYLQNRLRHILVGHEQGAMHAAEGYARSTGKPGVVLVTSGPGATNTVTGLVDAMMDSIPLVVLTGQVVSNLIGNDAFQEADTTGITRAATKHNYLVRSTEDLARTLHEAFYVATHGRPGPVLVDIPKDVILGMGAYVEAEHGVPRNYTPRTEPDMAKIEEAVELLASAKKPIIYAGGGVINAGPHASKLLAQLVHLTGFPCTTTLMALGAFPASDPLFLGMPGMHGTYEANLTMHHCDVMFNVGARFDDRVTGKLANFAPHARKIHIDIDPSSINKNVQVEVPIIADAGEALAAIIKVWKRKKKTIDAKALKSWWKQIGEWRGVDCLAYDQGKKDIKPQYALERLRYALNGTDFYVTTDVGQHQMWAAQFLHFDEPNRWMTSGGLGTMGYGVPAAMGVQVAHPDANVVCVTSEGSLLMNVQEMSTIARYKLPVKILNLNNDRLGMIRQWQELFHSNHESECDLAGRADYIKLAEAFGFTAIACEDPKDVDATLKKMLATRGPVFVNMVVDKTENVFPMIPAGAPHNEIVLGPNQKMKTVDDRSNVMA
jgi:acetolactate synthase-1/2/3 large subunit